MHSDLRFKIFVPKWETKSTDLELQACWRHSFKSEKHVILFVLATMTAKYEELEQLYTGLGKIIYEGLTNYAKYDNLFLLIVFFVYTLL